MIGLVTNWNIPKSIAIIMDGNRRFAQSKSLEKIQGHEQGLNKLLEVIDWCILLGVRELTVFAFSIDNFNRPKEEYDALMSLARDKFAKLADKDELIQSKGVKIQIFGNIDFIDDKTQESLRSMEEKTQNNVK